MGDLERVWRIREEEERGREHRRKLTRLSDEHWERTRSYGGVSLWIVLAVVLYLAISFAHFAYGVYQAQQKLRPAVKPPAPQGLPPQDNTRRSRAQGAPSHE